MSKPYIMFVPVERNYVIGDLADFVIFGGYLFPSGVCSNDAAEPGGSTEHAQKVAQSLFAKGIVALHLLPLLVDSGYTRVIKVTDYNSRPGAYVEFPDRNTAMIFKLRKA